LGQRKRRVWYNDDTISVQLSTLFAMVMIGVNNHFRRLFNYKGWTCTEAPFSVWMLAAILMCNTCVKWSWHHMEFEQALDEATRELGLQCLKPKQREVIELFVSGKDVMVILLYYVSL